MAWRRRAMVMITALATGASGCGVAAGSGESDASTPTISVGGGMVGAGGGDRANPPRRLSWSAANCSLPDAPTGPIGNTAEALRSSFGGSVADTRFVLGRGLTPPRMTLLNRLPLKGNEQVAVREIIWAKGGCTLTVWLTRQRGSWRAVQTARSSAGAEY